MCNMIYVDMYLIMYNVSDISLTVVTVLAMGVPTCFEDLH